MLHAGVRAQRLGKARGFEIVIGRAAVDQRVGLARQRVAQVHIEGEVLRYIRMRSVAAVPITPTTPEGATLASSSAAAFGACIGRVAMP